MCDTLTVLQNIASELVRTKLTHRQLEQKLNQWAVNRSTNKEYTVESP